MEIRPLKTEEIEKYIEYYRADRHGARGVRPEYFRWAFVDTPRDDIECSMFVIVDEGKIVGNFGTLPTPFYVEGEKLKGGFLSDFFIKNEYRGKRLGRGIVETILNSGFYDMLMVYGYNDKAGAIFNKIFQVCSDTGVPQYIFTALPRLRTRKWLAPLAAVAIYTINKSKSRKSSVSEKSPGDSSATIIDPGKIENSFFLTRKNIYCTVATDAAYLKWRYFSSPIDERPHHLIEVKTGDRVRGYAVISIFNSTVSFDNCGVATIQDALDDGDYESRIMIIDAIINYSVRNGASIIFGMFFNREWRQAFADAGAVSDFGFFSRFINTYRYRLAYQTRPGLTRQIGDLSIDNAAVFFGNGDGGEHFFF